MAARRLDYRPQERRAGLPVPSIVRFTPFTLDHRLLRGKLGRLAEKDRVKLRKALRMMLPYPSCTDRLGGHLMTGHVDGVGAVTRFSVVDGDAGGS